MDTSMTERSSTPALETDFTVWDMLARLGQVKRLLLVGPLVFALLMLGLGLILPKTYTAHTSLLPPSSGSSSASAALAALSPMLSGSGFGGRAVDELYVRLLNSDTVLHSMDERLHLRERLRVKSFEKLRQVIPAYVQIVNDKRSGMVQISVGCSDRVFSAVWANAYYQALQQMLAHLAVSDAQQRRAFFENQATLTKKQLVQAEQELQRVQEKTGVVALDQQAQSLMETMARLRTQIMDREIKLKVMLTSATQQNPEVIKLNSELQGLKSELARLESTPQPQNTGAVIAGTSNPSGSAQELLPSKLPQTMVEQIRLRREVKFQEAMLQNLMLQLSSARLDEAKEGVGPQVIDPAMPPDEPSKPKIPLMVVGGYFFALFALAIGVILKHRVSLQPLRDAMRRA